MNTCVAVTEKKTLAKQLFGVFGIRIAHYGIALASAVIIARLLGPEGKGILNLVMIFNATLTLIFAFGLSNSLVFHTGRKKYEPGRLLSVCLFWIIAILLVSVPASLIFVKLTLKSVFRDIGISYLAAGIAIFAVGLFNLVLLASARGMEKVYISASIPLIQGLTSLSILFALVYFFGLGVKGAFIAYFATELLTFFILASAVIPKAGFASFIPSYDKAITKDLFNIGLKSYSAGLTQHLNYRLDVFVINYFLNPAQVGIYSTGVSIAEMVLMVPSVICFILFPKASNCDRETASRLAVSFVRRGAWISLSAALFICLASPFLIPLLFGEAFAFSKYVVFVLAPGIVILTFSWVLGAYFEGTGKPQIVFYATSAALPFTLILNLLFIPNWGILGAAAASVVSYSISAVTLIAIFTKMTGNRITELLIPKRSDFSLSQFTETK